MARFPWDPEPVSADEVKIDVDAPTLPEGTPCRIPDDMRSVVVVGCPDIIVLPNICVLTGVSDGIRHTFRLAVAPSRPTPGKVAAYVLASAIGPTYNIECTVPRDYVHARMRLKIVAALLTLLGLISGVLFFVVDVAGEQAVFSTTVATVLMGLILTLLISGIVLFRHAIRPPFIVAFACGQFVQLKGLDPGLTLTLPLLRPIGGRRY